MSTNNNVNEHQQSLTEQLATRLVQGDEKSDAASMSSAPLKPTKACIAVAGGGSNAAATIASIPGASSLLLESIITYDRRSYADFVSQNIVQNGKEADEAWLMDLESSLEGGADDTDYASSDGNSISSKSNESFHFCSTQAAMLLSRSALHRSLQLTPSFHDQSLHCIGVGCTSSLVGKVSPAGEVIGGRKGRKSRAYIACSTLRDGTWVWEVELDSNNNLQMEGEAKTTRRSRSEEEAVISNLVLLAMVQYREQSNGSKAAAQERYHHILSQILDRQGDNFSEKKVNEGAIKEGGESPAAGTSRIINGSANVVAVLPVTHSNERQMEALFSDSNIPFPQDVLIVPGSFNPPHQGHIGLANAAVSALRRLRQKEESGNNNNNNNNNKNAITSSSRPYSRYSSLSSVASSSSPILKNLWSVVDQYSEEQYEPTVFFEMSVTNADKPPLDPLQVERRVNIFTSLPSSEMPKDWGIILTNAPLFSQKTSILDELIAGHSEGSLCSENPTNRKMSFVLGTDTMVRIINPKYYGNSRENMLAALVNMKEMGVHFIVGGRLEQGSENMSKFVNGEEEVKSLPAGIQKMFTLLTEDEFRLDISSTELRKRSRTETIKPMKG
ncbi:hypothetical protein ACHAXR_004327 [Thalassiosira sp. AJA248-18]